MPRVIGIDIPDNKRLEISLMYIYGIGRRLSNEICAKLGLNPDMRAHNLTEDENSKDRWSIDLSIHGRRRST